MTEVTLTLDDVTLRGTVTGAGPTVLLLHAGGERRSVWTPVAAQLADSGLRTVAFDLRGHGDSSGQATTLRTVADDVIEILSRETGPLVVVGASLGGLAALAALAKPTVVQRVAGLILVDVVPDPDPQRARAWLDEHGLIDRHPEIVTDILESSPELVPTAAELDMPILLIRAGHGSPLGDADANRLSATNPHVTITHVPRAGHLVAHDAPDELARIVSAHATTWLATDEVVHHAFELQRSLGAENLDHPGGTLYAHLRRVHTLAAEWNASPRTQLTAICHASYGTDGFQHPLLPTTERQQLQHTLGPEAESLVYLYDACDRARTYPHLGQDPLPIHDRFTGKPTTIHGAELRDFAILTIINELDVARHAHLPASAIDDIRSLIAALATYAPDESARALTDEALA